MQFTRLLDADGTWSSFQSDWTAQCVEADDTFDDYAPASLGAIRQLALAADPSQWALALRDETRFLAVAMGICTFQKGFSGKVLRIREVTVCPLLDYGILPEEQYVDTLVGMLNAAVKLSESELVANHIKMHLRSPSDRLFFRAVGNVLDSKGVFASSETHGAWLTFTKLASPLRIVD